MDPVAAATDGQRSGGQPAGVLRAPASYGQQRLWFLSELHPGAHLAYHMLGAVRLDGILDAVRLERALGAVVARHETLRTTFSHDDAGLHQLVRPPTAFTLHRVDLTGTPVNRHDAAVAALRRTEATTPFDLARGPLVRGTLIRTGRDRHTLLLGLHHTICDGWSLSVLLTDVAAAYRDPDGAGQRPLPVQYADFAAWQQQRFTAGEFAPDLAYWRGQLAGLAPVPLPTRRTPPPVPTFGGAATELRITDHAAARLAALARAEGATLHMALLAAVSALLHRLTGSADLGIGTPVAGRRHPDLERLIGFFVNTLVIRTRHPDGTSFRGLLRHTRDTCLDAYAHQDLPFEKLVEQLRPDRDLATNPLFQVMVRIGDHTAPGPELPGLRLTRLAAPSALAAFPLDFAFRQESGGALGGQLVYQTDRFDAGDASRIADQFATLLDAVLAEPDRPVRLQPVMPPGQLAAVLRYGQAPSLALPRAGVPEQVAARAAATPGATAVRHGTGELTYRELDRAANRLAHRLVAGGVGPDSVVAVCVPRTPALVVALLAVLKAGAAYLPLDPGYPAERLRYMLADSGAGHLLVHPDTQPPEHPGLPTTDVSLPYDEEPETAPEHPAGAAHLAYVIYTSGSTGRPKATAVTQGGLVNVLAGMASADGFGPERTRTVAALTTPSFDIATLELFLPLVQGGSVALIDRADALDPARLAERLDAYGVTFLQATPSTWRVLLETGWTPRQPLTALAGGEALTPELAARLRAVSAYPWNGYGPSETAIYATRHRIGDDAPVPIGRPVENTRAYVLDDWLQPVPVGVTGELYLGGAGVGRGYLNQPGATAQRFLPDPYAESAGARLYRTGDLARWRDDGVLEYLGRGDHQVKIRGHRIELGEIESALRGHPDVRDAVVVAREHPGGDRRLAGYVTGTATPDELLRHLRGRLPEFLVPASLTMLDALPLTPNGKVDRAALPAPGRTGSEGYVAPRTPLETRIADDWRELLGTGPVGVHDNFFELGGHSLLAARAVTRLRAALRIDVPLRTLFEHPTVSGLATALADARQTAAAPIPRQPRVRGAAR